MSKISSYQRKPAPTGKVGAKAQRGLFPIGLTFSIPENLKGMRLPLAILIQPDGKGEFVALAQLPVVAAGEADLRKLLGTARFASKLMEPEKRTNIGLSLAASLKVPDKERPKVAPKLIEAQHKLENLVHLRQLVRDKKPESDNEAHASIVTERILNIIETAIDVFITDIKNGKNNSSIGERVALEGIPPRLVDKLLSRKYEPGINLYHLYFPKDWKKSSFVYTTNINWPKFQAYFTEILDGSKVFLDYFNSDEVVKELASAPKEDLQKLKIYFIPNVPLRETFASLSSRPDYGQIPVSIANIVYLNKMFVDSCCLITGGKGKYPSTQFVREVLGLGNKGSQPSIPEVRDLLEKKVDLSTLKIHMSFDKKLLESYGLTYTRVFNQHNADEVKNIAEFKFDSNSLKNLKADLIPLTEKVEVEKKALKLGINANAPRFSIIPEGINLVKAINHKVQSGKLPSNVASAVKVYLSVIESAEVQGRTIKLLRPWILDGVPLPREKGRDWGDQINEDELADVPDYADEV